jgi:malate permease and related proteins
MPRRPAHQIAGRTTAERGPARPLGLGGFFTDRTALHLMTHTTLIINRVLPILFLLGLGVWIRRREFLPNSTIDDLRKIVVNFALPAVLFISFLNITLELKYLVLFVTIYALCLALFAFGRVLQRRWDVQYTYFPFMMTGFEYGMLGVSLFGSAYGLDKIGYIAVADLGHELFIWSFFLALLLKKRDGLQHTSQMVLAVFRSPVMIGIMAGIAFNVAGLQDFLYDKPVTGAVMATLDFLSHLTIPLVLIIVGHGIRLNWTAAREAFPVIAVRLGLLIPLALVINALLVRGLLGLEKPFEIAVFTLLILPPPFIVPLFMREGLPDERRYINNVLMLYTVVAITIFAVYFSLNPEL